MPAAGWGWLDGFPIGPVEAAALALIWWTWAANRRLPGLRIVVVLAVVKVVLGGVFVDRGFAARYYANDTWAPPAERSVEFRDDSFTRRDKRLAFGTAGAPDLPLHFFNDLRFNYFRPSDPQRDRLAYSVEWNGFLYNTSDASPVAFYITAGEGISGLLSIDGRQVITAAGARIGSVALTRGWHALNVRVAAPYGAERHVEAGEIVEGTAHPFDQNRIFPQPVGSVRRASDAALRWVARVVDVLVLSWLGLLALMSAREGWRDRRIGHLLWLGAVIEALLFAGAHVNRVITLSGGNDWLTYEYFARTIALGDWLLREPAFGGGQGVPFYYQPLYPYFIALTHLGFGDSLFGVVLVQRVLLFAAVWWASAMTRRLFGSRAGWIALVGGGLFLYARGGRWTEVLLGEALFTPLLVAWTGMLVRQATEGVTWPRLVAAGVIGGVATLTRSTLLLAWPVMLPLWWASLRPRRRRLLAVLLAVMLAVVGLATLRNWIVSRTFVPVATSFGVNLHTGNVPSGPLTPAPPVRSRVYERLGLDPYTRTVAEYAFQRPADFFANLGRKMVFSIGFFEWSGMPGGGGVSWLYVAMWPLTLAAVIRLRRRNVSDWSLAVWLPLAGALSHLAMVVLVHPFGYNDRLILPLYPLLIPYAAFAIEPLTRPELLSRICSSVGRCLAPAIDALPQFARVARQHPRRWLYLARQHPRRWLYLGYSAALIQRLIWPVNGSETSDLVLALLLPVMALTVARLTQHELVHRAVGGALFAAVLIGVGMNGSRSPAALRDPLFWLLVAAVSAGLSGLLRRRHAAAIVATAVAGGCAMVAVLLPFIPDFDSTFPAFDWTVVQGSLSALSRAGVFGALCLLGLWTQAIVARSARESGNARVLAGVRGALLVALVLGLAGAWPHDGEAFRAPIIILAVLLGLAEAPAR